MKTIAELIGAASVVKANRLEDADGPLGPEPPIDDGCIVPKQQDGNTFPTLSLADCLARQSEPTRWLIDGVLPERGLACVFGRSNSFKSFVVIDQACHIAHGRPYHGRAVIQAPAMYLALEGSSGVIRQRVPGWHRHYGLLNTEPQLAVIETPVTLTKAPDAEKLKRTALALWGRLPGLIVIDVLKRTMDGSETDDEVVARFIHSLQTTFLTDHKPCLILVITHSGFSVDDRARGHSDLWGSYDTRLIAEGDKEHLTTCLTVERHKDAESGGAIAFNMKVVDTGMIRDDMAPITTLVPEADETSKPKIKQSTLKPELKHALGQLTDCIARAGESPPAGLDLPNSVRVVPLETWRIRFYAGLGDDFTADAKRKEFWKVRGKLAALGVIGISEAWVWVVRAAQPQIGKPFQPSQNVPFHPAQKQGEPSRSVPVSLETERLGRLERHGTTCLPADDFSPEAWGVPS
ncbi:MAG: AAA family ATPase [Rhodospirillaceae bacterium]